MDSQQYFEYLVSGAEQAASSFKGWIFSYLNDTGRSRTSPEKWNYFNKIQPYLFEARTLLDMGTGGGEFLSRLQPLPPAVYAVEEYPPNVAAASTRLSPLGINVVGLPPKNSPPFFDRLPFEADFFDLVINRHSAYTVAELKRILKPGASFITQQVGPQTFLNLKLIMSDGKLRQVNNWNLKSAIDELQTESFEIVDGMEDSGYARFYDVGALVYHLLSVPWTIPGFNPRDYLPQLLYLHNQIQTHGYFDATFDWFFLIAKK